MGPALRRNGRARRGGAAGLRGLLNLSIYQLPFGKTVLLTELEDLATQQGWVVLRATGRTDSVRTLIETTIPAKIAELGPLTDADAHAILTATAADSGRPFVGDAAGTAVHIARGYPHLVQLVGFLAWNRAGDTITIYDVEAVQEEAVRMMDAQVHAPSLKGVPPAHLGRRPNEVTDTRGKLLDRGLIEAPAWGRACFTLPYLAEFLRGQSRPTRVS